MKECRQFMVFGHVQGVGFRKFIKAKVDSINAEGELLSGNIQNLSDGSVRVVAQGEADVLQKLEQLLEVGTIKSKVSSVQSISLEVDDSMSGFVILT